MNGGIKPTGTLGASFCCLVLICGVSFAGPITALRGLWEGSHGDFRGTGGWKDEGEPVGTPRGRSFQDGGSLTLSGWFEDIYRCEGPEGKTAVSFWKVRASQLIPIGRDGAYGNLRVGVEDVRLFSKIPIEDGEGHVRLSHLQRHWSLAYSRRLGPRFGIGGGIGGRANDFDPSHLDGSLRIAIKPFAGWRVDAQVTRSFQSNPLKARLNEELLDLTTEFGLTYYRASLTAPLDRRVTVKLTGGGGRLRPDAGSDGYVNRMTADWWDGGLQFLLLPSEKRRITGAFRGGRGTGAQSGQLEGDPFSKLRLESWCTEFQVAAAWRLNNRLSLDVALLRGVWAFRARKGRLESWPFLPGFLSLLGGKDWSLKGSGSLKVERYSAEAQFDVTEALELGSVFRFVRLEPEADLVSRERIKSSLITIFLPEIEIIESPITRMDLLDTGLHARWRIGKVRLEYGVTQMIPVKVSRKEPSEGDRRKRGITKERGGTAYRLSVTYLLKNAK